MDENEFLVFLAVFGLILLQETHLFPGQHDSLPLPEGYLIYSCARPFPPNLDRQWGGVLALVHRSVEHTFRADLSSPDVLVLDLAGMCVINAYLPPRESPAMLDTSPDPVERFIAALSACCARASKPVLVALDANGRTRDSQPASWAPERQSVDTEMDTRGRVLTRVFGMHELAILNGLLHRFPTSGAWTSEQPMGRSVIDYILCAESLFDCIQLLDVGPTQNFWSDHAPLTLELLVPLHSRPPPGSARSRSQNTGAGVSVLPGRLNQRLHNLVDRTVASALKPNEAAVALYGSVPTHTVHEYITVYTDGSCSKPESASASAGAGVCWGLGCKENAALRVPGEQTSNRAELYAALAAVRAAPPERPLRIYTDSQNTIRTCCHWAPTLSMTGWACANSDVVIALIWALKRRRALTRFEWVQGHSGNALNEEADRLAKLGSTFPPSLEVLPADDAGPTIGASDCPAQDGLCAKVVTSLSPRPIRDAFAASHRLTRDDFVCDGDGAPEHGVNSTEYQRGKRARRAKAATNLDALEKVQTERDFWLFVYHVSHPRSRMAVLALDVLTNCFSERMNMPRTLPPEFDPAVVQEAARAAANIGDCTHDSTQGGYFSRRFTVAEIARLKARIRSRPPGRSVGFDMVAFALLLDIPNDLLEELYNECLRCRSVPDGWLLTILVAIMKRGGVPTDASSYRTVGLESCLLKFFMMLIDGRVREWVQDNNLLPPTQNGFRAGRRTNNNAFILRCASERARACKKVLYLASVDISNAFPSVSHHLLWKKLHALGMGGPIFDTYRAVYEYMTYCVRVEKDYSDLFTSDMGVLIGDPASPIMWLLYFADVVIPETVDDIRLNGARISHLEQADDIIIFATSPEALQKKLDAFFAWCCRNLLRVNGRKSWWMPLGSRPRNIPVFHINNEPVPLEREKAYVGMIISSTLSTDQRAHTTEKAMRAHRISCLVFGVLDRKCLEVPPKPARKLYMGLVDPHLTHGCDVLPDSTLIASKTLEQVQKNYLRKLLRVGPKSCVAPLHTETGLSPIRFRRADLAVRYLGYVMQQPVDDLLHHALVDSRALAAGGKKSWYGDLRKALQKLPVPVDLGWPEDAADIDGLRTSVKQAELDHLRVAIQGSAKLPLLVRRVGENCLKQMSLRPAPTLVFREYLKIPAREHRVALTRLLLSDHPLAVERLRYDNVPHEDRKCRLCHDAVEDEGHALFDCTGSEQLPRLRTELEDDVRRLKGEQAVCFLREQDAHSTFQLLLADSETVSALARFTYHVLRCFEEQPMYRP